MSARQPLAPGVYQEWLGGQLNYEAVIIVGHSDDGWDCIGIAWRHDPESDWRGPWKDPGVRRGAFHRDTLRPHPDGDAIWAEYCASQLSD